MFFSSYLKCRWINDQNIALSSIGFNETFGYHSGNHGLTQTYDICEEQAVMLHQHLVTLYHGILLVFQLFYAVGQFKREVVLHLVAESVNKHFDVNFVRRRLVTEVSLLLVLGYVPPGLTVLPRSTGY